LQKYYSNCETARFIVTIDANKLQGETPITN